MLPISHFSYFKGELEHYDSDANGLRTHVLELKSERMTNWVNSPISKNTMQRSRMYKYGVSETPRLTLKQKIFSYASLNTLSRIRSPYNSLFLLCLATSVTASVEDMEHLRHPPSENLTLYISCISPSVYSRRTVMFTRVKKFCEDSHHPFRRFRRCSRPWILREVNLYIFVIVLNFVDISPFALIFLLFLYKCNLVDSHNSTST